MIVYGMIRKLHEQLVISIVSYCIISQGVIVYQGFWTPIDFYNDYLKWMVNIYFHLQNSCFAG